MEDCKWCHKSTTFSRACVGISYVYDATHDILLDETTGAWEALIHSNGCGNYVCKKHGVNYGRDDIFCFDCWKVMKKHYHPGTVERTEKENFSW